jgi:Flp pilus assembly protein TadD
LKPICSGARIKDLLTGVYHSRARAKRPVPRCWHKTFTKETGNMMAIGVMMRRNRAASQMNCVVAAAVCALLLGACGGVEAPLALNEAPETAREQVADANAPPRTELEKATEYWGKAAANNPRDPKAAINYAKNLRAMGQKERALSVLQAAYEHNSGNRNLSSEYGRLALELDQFSTAQKLLEQADDPTNPDWKTISARGTVLAKQGKYHEAIPHFERALTVSPGQPSVLNNLALARAMDGHPDKAEALLRQAADRGSDDPKITQNLSLVLGLQGKYEEAKAAGQKALSAESASDDVGYVRQIVKLEPRSGNAAPAATFGPMNAVADASKGGGVAKIATASTTKSKPGKTAGSEPKLDGLAAAAALADAHAANLQNGTAKDDAYRPSGK